MRKGKTVTTTEAIFDVDEFLQGRDSPHAILVGFYKELCALFEIDWDDVECIEPAHVRLNEKDWNKICDRFTSFATSEEGKIDLSFTFINKGPGSDADIPVGTIQLLNEWIEVIT